MPLNSPSKSIGPWAALRDPRIRRTVIIGTVAIALLSLPTALEYFGGGKDSDPVALAGDLFELLVFAGTIASMSWLTLEMREIRSRHDVLLEDLSGSRAENRKWRESQRDQINGFRAAVLSQFNDWELSAAERDIASLMLKGCSHKQIAAVRQSNESTVRQQAQSIYRKSALNNRAELSAYFLDAILTPEMPVDGA
tara:strand:- start:22266 stop:22853 length:588 start_codon:yes stop_codon:yes gene_type:complete